MGGDGNGELGVGNTRESCGTGQTIPCSRIPRAVGGLTSVTAIGAGWRFSLALQDGTALSWGADELGQLGDGASASSPVPVQVSGLSGVQRISAGETSSLALLLGEGPPPVFQVRPEPGALLATWRAPKTKDTWAIQWRLFTKPHPPWEHARHPAAADSKLHDQRPGPEAHRSAREEQVLRPADRPRHALT